MKIISQLHKSFYIFLHPRYWPTWFVLGLLWLLVQLPYPLLYWIGTKLGRQSMFFLKERVRITRRNLELCFPNMNQTQLDKILIDTFTSLGIGLIETGMAWFWSDTRIKNLVDVSGLQHLQQAKSSDKGVIVIGIHFMSLELGGRAMGLYQPIMAMYRPHNNKVIEFIQTWGRMRSNNAMVNRKKLSNIVHALRKGKIVWFAPDQDYGPQGSIFAPFFAVSQAATTRGIYILFRLTHPELIPAILIRKEDKSGYQLLIQSQLKDYPQDDEMAATCYINKIIEQQILRAPDQYLWLHRRFKTRPDGEVSFYGLARK